MLLDPHPLLSLVKGISLGAETSGSAGALEVSAESGSKEGSENDLSATARNGALDACSYRSLFVGAGNLPESGKSQPQQEDELENKVKGEPVNNAEEALDDGEEGKNNPVLRKNQRSRSL